MSKQRDMSERQFLEALKRHGMKFETMGRKFETMDYVNLGIPGCNRWDKPPAGLNKRAKLAYLLASKERALAKSKADREADAKVDPELMLRSLPRGEDR
jgi:hypothetical protein